MSFCYTAIKIEGPSRARACRSAPQGFVLQVVELKVRVATDQASSKGVIQADDLVRLSQGDRAAFRRVYVAYAGLVRFVALKHALSREEADEVTQETFLKLHVRSREVRDPARIKAWLVTTVRNLAIDRLRSRQRQAPVADPEVLEAAAETLWPEATTAAREAELALVRELVERIASSPGGETFRRFYVDGCSAKEIAQANGEAISTVTTRLSRMRERFREELRVKIESLRDGAS